MRCLIRDGDIGASDLQARDPLHNWIDLKEPHLGYADSTYQVVGGVNEMAYM